MNKKYVGNGEVVLISGGGKCYTDIAARFVGSERNLDDIISSKYNKNIVKNIINSDHGAATEFDYFIFGIQGYARVTEVQLVRKRLASYLIKSGRLELNGKRKYNIVIPNSIEKVSYLHKINPSMLYINGKNNLFDKNDNVEIELNTNNILDILEEWYLNGLNLGIPEEDLRYLKPQATEFKAIIGMNAHALIDWFKIRTCLNAQTEIRDLAMKMLNICKDASPDLFSNAGPSCKHLGYCPENNRQNINCKDKVLTKDEALKILKNYKGVNENE